MKGLLLAFQFFTVIPVKKELPMGRPQITLMFASLPFIGLFIGATMTAVYYVSETTMGFSPLFSAIVLVLTGLVMTGGLHIDGWADTADAFFSYQAIDKRHEILADPRLGAFGTIALIGLLLFKVVLIYESMIQGLPVILLLLFVPFITRASFNIVFTCTSSSKETGLGAFFKARLDEAFLVTYSSVLLLIIASLGGILLGKYVVMAVLLVLLFSSIAIFRAWTLKHFAGMSGDLSGAYIEGMEVVVWLVLLCLL